MSEERLNRVEKAMRSIHVLIEVCRIHGLESTVFKHSLDDNMPDILMALEGVSRIDLAFEDGRICFDNQVLPQADTSFRRLSRIMLQAGIMSLILRSGVKGQDIVAFVAILAGREEAVSLTGIAALLREKGITHIEVGNGRGAVGESSAQKAQVYDLDADGPVFTLE